ncbi:MAG: hypothetical protein JXA96_05705 [Sedimentisphaerales bacterium]|nr:hypothetical protein [Sedimentisphaerales bacterium]
MNENASGTNNLLDTTDCLEAVGVFRGWKNIFFIIIFLCILILQACFWISDLGMIDMPQEVSVEFGSLKIFYAEPELPVVPAGEDTILGIMDSNETAQPEEIDQPDMILEDNEPTETSDPNQIANEVGLVMLAAETTVSSPNDMSDTEDDAEAEFLSGITFDHIVWIMRFVNAILILIGILYCLTMLFSLKISMLGRLGGINHITRAFFLSLLMLVLVLPWQRIYSGVIMGAIFTPEEFVTWHAEKTTDIIDMVLYYMRFCGYMVLVFLLLILSQIRSGRWAKAILRRLEII